MHIVRGNRVALCLVAGAISVAAFFAVAEEVSAGAFLLSPSTGTFTVGNTFDVDILLDTQGKSVNALEVDLRFPRDRLQLVSPKTSVSVISVWTSQPQFNNQTGRVRLQGGIPRGVNLSNALVATLTFRVRSIGTGILRFSDESKILLNDGLGTDDLSLRGDAVYNFLLPPPAGPVVVSETHPDQSRWYASGDAILSWATDEASQGYSYVVNDEPVALSDDTSEGLRTTVAYKGLADGRHYFHIKSLRERVWGGSTHFALKVDTTPPARFPLNTIPGTHTSVRDPVIKFATTDELSGLERYDLKIVPLSPKPTPVGDEGNQQLFIEVESPYISPRLDLGPYDIIVRAYDKAGNFQEVLERLVISDSFFTVDAERGVVVFGYLIPWLWMILMGFALVGGLILVSAAVKRWHRKLDVHQTSGVMPHHLNKQLEELKQFKSRYGGAAMLLIIIGLGIFEPHKVEAEQIELTPPLVTTISRNVSNNEIFYIGGRTGSPSAGVILYTQNLTTGETVSYAITSDSKGEWFYRHDTFLSSGRYLLWTQAKIGEGLSPPSPQIEMTVGEAALQFGVSRISYETLYLVISFVSFAGILIFAIYILVDYRRARRRHRAFLKEFRDVEEAVRRGFAVLRRDIQSEIEALQKLKLSSSLKEEEEARERLLLRDLEDIERRIGKEIWDVERVEGLR